jgi:hypothetical protein
MWLVLFRKFRNFFLARLQVKFNEKKIEKIILQLKVIYKTIDQLKTLYFTIEALFLTNALLKFKNLRKA